MYSLTPTYRAVVTLHAPADVAGACWGGAGGDVTPVDERTCLLHSNADTLEWLAFRLTILGTEFRVHEPPQLVEYSHALGARATRAAGS